MLDWIWSAPASQLLHHLLGAQPLRRGFRSKHTRGVLILISGRVTYEHMATIKDKEGRFIMINWKVDGNLFTLYNVYTPPGSEPNVCPQIIEGIATVGQPTLIL